MKELIKKVLSKEVILYIIFGVLTTLVNLVSFYIMHSLLGWNENLSNIFTMIVEFVGGWILFKTPIPEMISKCVVTVVVIVLNFFISKFFAFKSNNKQDDRKREK